MSRLIISVFAIAALAYGQAPVATVNRYCITCHNDTLKTGGLTQHGADLNAADARGDRPLHIAARLGSNAIVRALVELGADVNARDASGKTALDLVTEPGRNRHEDTEQLLRELQSRL